MGCNSQHTKIVAQRLALLLLFTIRHIGQGAVERITQLRR